MEREPSPMNAQLKHEPKVIVRRRLTPATSPAPVKEEGLEEVIQDVIRGRTPGLRKLFERHCRNPQAMRPRTLWYLYLLFCKYTEDTSGLYTGRLVALREVLSLVPREIKTQVERPTKFEFLINLKSAKQLGLTLPPAMLARADKVIK